MTLSEVNDLIFLAYAKEDRQLVRLLFKKLQQAGFRPWLDEESISLGHQWETEIEKAIRECKVFLACISKNSIAKDGYVQRELALALNEAEKKANLHQRLIPVVLDDSEIPNITVGSINIAHFQGVNISSEAGLSRLISGLNDLIKVEEAPAEEIRDFQKLRELLAEGDLEMVLNSLGQLIHPADKRNKNAIIMLKAEYVDLDDRHTTGIVDSQSHKVEMARLRSAVLRVIDKVESGFKD